MIRYKLCVLLLTVTASYLYGQVDMDMLSFTALNNSTINMNNYVSQKRIVVTIDVTNPDKEQLQSFDSLYRIADGSIIVIGIPVNDFGSTLDSTALSTLLYDSLHISYPVSVISKGKRGIGQHPLMKWITTNSPKNHYNIDLEEAGQVFIISTYGILYTVAGKGLKPSVGFLKAAIQQNPIK